MPKHFTFFIQGSKRKCFKLDKIQVWKMEWKRKMLQLLEDYLLHFKLIKKTVMAIIFLFFHCEEHIRVESFMCKIKYFFFWKKKFSSTDEKEFNY